jgi:hypothetical protein
LCNFDSEKPPTLYTAHANVTRTGALYLDKETLHDAVLAALAVEGLEVSALE